MCVCVCDDDEHLSPLPPRPGAPSAGISDSRAETAGHTAAAGQEVPRNRTGSSICFPARTQTDVQRGSVTHS